MDFTIIYGLALAALGAGLIAIVRIMQTHFAKQVVRDISKVYEAMRRVINRTHADRFLILGLHNGGRRMEVYSKRYITIFEEDNSANVPAIKGDYKKIRVDGSYIKMVTRLVDDGVMSGWVKDLPPGLLRDAYEKDRIKYYYIFYIGYKDKTHFFGSISTTESASMETPSQYTEIRLATNKITHLMKRWRFF